MLRARTLLLCLVALLAFSAIASGESVVKKLKAKVEAGAAPAPCDKAAAVAGAAPPRQFLDQRLPVVVDDYHAPTGGFAVSHIPDKEVDVAARRILREIQAHEAEMKEMGADPNAAQQTTDGILTPEEHTALKQLLTDADILVRHAAKALAENGPIDAAAARRVAASAVLKAASAEKAAASAPAAAAAAAPAAAAAAAPAAAAAATPAPAAAAATPVSEPASKPVEPSAPLPASAAATPAPAAATPAPAAAATPAPAAAEPVQVKAAAPVAVSSKAARVRK